MLHPTVCVQVPGGWAAQRWGGRNTLMLSFALWSTASILTPITSVASAPIAVARMAVGVSQGLLIPSIHTVLAQVSTIRRPAFQDGIHDHTLFQPYVAAHGEVNGAQILPPEQRATAVSLTTSGMYMGSAGAIQFLPGLGRRFGAAFLTRFNGGLGLAWLLLWLSVSSRLPSRCALPCLQPAHEASQNLRYWMPPSAPSGNTQLACPKNNYLMPSMAPIQH